MAQSTGTRRLRKSSTDRVLFGVCGGLGQYFDVDPVFIRIIFVVLGLSCGTGFFLYLALAVFVPKEGADDAPGHVLRNNIASMPREATTAVRDASEGVFRSVAGESALRNAEPPPVKPEVRPIVHGDRNMKNTLAIILIFIGALFLATNLGLFKIRWDYIWPVLLIGAGVLMLARRTRY